MRVPWILLLATVLLAGCTQGGEVAVHVGVSDAWAGPALRQFGRDNGTTVGRAREPAQADVLWERSLEPVLELAGGGGLAVLDPHTADRVASMVGADNHWIGLAGVARALVYDPEHIAEAAVPTRLLDLARPEHARHLALADPTHGSAVWNAAALAEVLGEARALDFYRALLAGGARVVDSEEAAVAAVVAGDRPMALTDSDLALAAQDQQSRLVVIVPDQGEDGIGTLLLPVAVALTRRGAENPQARALLAHLLSTPVTLTLTLSGNQVLVLRDTNAPAGMLRATDLRTMQVSFGALAERLPALRTKLAGLQTPT